MELFHHLTVMCQRRKLCRVERIISGLLQEMNREGSRRKQ